jgi:hypothetical protein
MKPLPGADENRRFGEDDVVAGAMKAAACQLRMRAMAPATICINTPTTHPAMIITVMKICGSSRNTITLTDTKADSVARKVPTALRKSAASIFPPEASGGVSIPR